MATPTDKSIDLEPGWLSVLGDEFYQPYMLQLKAFLLQEKQQGKVVYPAAKAIFNAFNHTPFDKTKVVIIGQDPYHGPEQAHGLCFSVQPGVKVPPSLVNIFKELHSDLGVATPATGDLRPWAKQGVLLLNATLTVEQARAGSHQGKGWEMFTDSAIDALNQKRDGLVFLLWGSYAQKKGQFIDEKRHLVLRAPHPSPLSAHRGFLGCRHFSQANSYLIAQRADAIDWSLR